MQTYTEHPGDKTYYAVNGHEMVASPSQGRNGKWFYIYSLASHSDTCGCLDSNDW